MNNEELITNVYRSIKDFQIFYKIEIKDRKNNVFFEGKLFTEQIQDESTKVENLDQKIMEAIKDIPKRIVSGKKYYGETSSVVKSYKL